MAKNSDLKTFRVFNAQLYASTGSAGSTVKHLIQATVVDVLVDIIFFLDLVSRLQVQRFACVFLLTTISLIPEPRQLKLSAGHVLSNGFC